jgi:hypothetical protein
MRHFALGSVYSDVFEDRERTVANRLTCYSRVA